jgi:DNA repair protein RadC
MTNIQNPNAGHRKRIRNKFVEHGLDVFQDYEVLELILDFVSRQKDMKPVAKELINCFGSFQAVIDADIDDLLSINGIGENAVVLIKLVKDSAARYLFQTSQNLFDRENIEDFANYCRLRMGHLKDEEFHMFSFNTQFQLVKEDILSEGTVDQTMVYPRKVIELAIKNNASSVIFCHNHPDGNLEPSDQDKLLTKALQLATKTVNINVHDHLIVSNGGYFSFRENRLI